MNWKENRNSFKSGVKRTIVQNIHIWSEDNLYDQEAMLPVLADQEIWRLKFSILFGDL